MAWQSRLRQPRDSPPPTHPRRALRAQIGHALEPALTFGVKHDGGMVCKDARCICHPPRRPSGPHGSADPSGTDLRSWVSCDETVPFSRPLWPSPCPNRNVCAHRLQDFRYYMSSVPPALPLPPSCMPPPLVTLVGPQHVHSTLRLAEAKPPMWAQWLAGPAPLPCAACQLVVCVSARSVVLRW